MISFASLFSLYVLFITLLTDAMSKTSKRASRNQSMSVKASPGMKEKTRASRSFSFDNGKPFILVEHRLLHGFEILRYFGFGLFGG